MAEQQHNFGGQEPRNADAEQIDDPTLELPDIMVKRLDYMAEVNRFIESECMGIQTDFNPWRWVEIGNIGAVNGVDPTGGMWQPPDENGYQASNLNMSPFEFIGLYSNRGQNVSHNDIREEEPDNEQEEPVDLQLPVQEIKQDENQRG
ncbi:unnamed protein product [Caenorhabditis bovis]|uniref:Uncharacterized protein n=1 Tax=Caenorhabditis bovis TaxID=2654633 RepID=A0A8S1F984_9PELO|nr:unnamed protein product [Caenorhabditis bovis]